MNLSENLLISWFSIFALVATGQTPFLETVQASDGTYRDNIHIYWELPGDARQLHRSKSPDGKIDQNMISLSNRSITWFDYDNALKPGVQYFYRIEYTRGFDIATYFSKSDPGSLAAYAFAPVWESVFDDTKPALPPLSLRLAGEGSQYIVQIADSTAYNSWTSETGFATADSYLLDTYITGGEPLIWLPPANIKGRFYISAKANDDPQRPYYSLPVPIILGEDEALGIGFNQIRLRSLTTNIEKPELVSLAMSVPENTAYRRGANVSFLLSNDATVNAGDITVDIVPPTIGQPSSALALESLSSDQVNLLNRKGLDINLRFPANVRGNYFVLAKLDNGEYICSNYRILLK